VAATATATTAAATEQMGHNENPNTSVTMAEKIN